MPLVTGIVVCAANPGTNSPQVTQPLEIGTPCSNSKALILACTAMLMFRGCRAKEKSSGRLCALKKVKLDTRRDREGFPLTALREVRS